jgi:hypothetical protein
MAEESGAQGLPDSGFQLLVPRYKWQKSMSAKQFFQMYKGHNEVVWRMAFEEAGDGTKWPNMDAIKELRTVIFMQTLEVVRVRDTRQRPEEVRAGPEAFVEAFVEVGLPEEVRAGPFQRVEVREMDILEVAAEFNENDVRVAVLNMACGGHPGGGVRSGRGAQEENLYPKLS